MYDQYSSNKFIEKFINTKELKSCNYIVDVFGAK